MSICRKEANLKVEHQVPPSGWNKDQLPSVDDTLLRTLAWWSMLGLLVEVEEPFHD